MAQDITLPVGDGYFNLRVGAIIQKDGKVLMVGNDAVDYVYSVGGRVQFGESLEDAVALLAPLLQEEIKAPLVINRMDEGPSGRTLLALGFGSILLYRIGESTGAWLLFYTTGAFHQWNRLRFPAHRLFADLLSSYDLARE